MRGQSVLYAFNNVGHETPGRSFPGFRKLTHARDYWLAPRESVHLEVKPGDLLSLEDMSAKDQLALVAFDG
ncbi:MAG: hypothetical protein NXI02_25935, partial [Rhodobacteraceae bacterium]|nr:hypothetical protein [Paracoccaceae bacterium]